MTPDAPKRTFFRRLFRILPKLRQWLRTRALYRKADYLEAYAAHTDMRVQQDPHSAIGGKWEAMGKLQFDFLVRQGLQAQHSLLDIGCGTLRGGRHFIRHLDAGNYTGLDISPGALDSARSLVKAEGLESKRPMLVLSEGRNLRFEEFLGHKFDYLLAQSVFTHLLPEHISECFAHVGQVMTASSCFFFTFFESPDSEQTSHKDFRYPFSFFEKLAHDNGAQLLRHDSYDHPRQQRMVCFTLKS